MEGPSMSQIMGGASIVFAVGFGIVFITLIVIIALITLQSMFFKGAKPAKKEEPKPEIPAVPAVAPAVSAEDEDEIAAVIAAVLALYDREGGNGLVVRSVRRIGANTPAWSNSGRQEYINTRY